MQDDIGTLVTELDISPVSAPTFEERMALRKQREEQQLIEPDKPLDTIPGQYRWRAPKDVKGVRVDTRALLRLPDGLIIAGAVYPEGHVAAFNLATSEYITIPEWRGIIGWFPTNELPIK